MPKIYATISERMVQQLNEISYKNNVSFSRAVHDMIRIGLESKESKDSISGEKNAEYLLRILNIVSEILRKIYSEPSKCGDVSAEKILEMIKNSANGYIDNKHVYNDDHIVASDK